MQLLVDGDFLLYRGGFSSQHTWYEVYIDQEEEDGWIGKFKYKKHAEEWINGQEDLLIIKSISVDSLHIALSNTRNIIKKIVNQCNAYTTTHGMGPVYDKDITMYFSPDVLKRDKIATLQKYKGNRDDAPRPHWYSEIKDYITRNYVCVEFPGLEADDGMALDQNSNTIICTPDKDLNMVPGLRWNLSGGVDYISVEEARRSFYNQLLTGDSTDNIPGLFKLTGQRAAVKYKRHLDTLETDREMYGWVKNVYVEAFGCGELNDVDAVLLEIGRLLWMARPYLKEWKIPEEGENQFKEI